MAVRQIMRCSSCGSTDVVRDAWAEWDVATQSWVMRGNPFDDGYCNDCEASGGQVIEGIEELVPDPDPDPNIGFIEMTDPQDPWDRSDLFHHPV